MIYKLSYNIEKTPLNSILTVRPPCIIGSGGTVRPWILMRFWSNSSPQPLNSFCTSSFLGKKEMKRYILGIAKEWYFKYTENFILHSANTGLSVYLLSLTLSFFSSKIHICLPLYCLDKAMQTFGSLVWAKTSVFGQVSHNVEVGSDFIGEP